MQIPILNGIYTDQNGDFRSSYPRNKVPVALENGISKGYLRPAPGIVKNGDGPGVDRGAINWNNSCFRVMGTKLIKIDSVGNNTVIGDVGGTGQCSLDYSPDYLAVASGGNLFLYNGSTLTQVTDSDLGTVLDVSWIDGYFMTTDGEFLVVTELNNPFSVNPLKYGTSEADPDPVTGLTNIKNEQLAKNRYTIEYFDNTGGDNFPFSRIEGAQIEKGVIGTHASSILLDTLAFVGSGRNEAPGVYLASNGQAIKLSTREIDKILASYTEEALSEIVCETRKYDNKEDFHIHLPNKTLVYDAIGSRSLAEHVWYTLDSGLQKESQYRARNFVWCYDKWLCGDPQSSQHGYLVDNISSHYDKHVGWEFGTSILYNQSKGAIVHETELVALTGIVALDDDPVVFTDYSLDGETYSMPRQRKSGKQGKRSKRLSWRVGQGSMKDRRIQRFYGDSKSHLSAARLEMELEPLYV